MEQLSLTGWAEPVSQERSHVHHQPRHSRSRREHGRLSHMGADERGVLQGIGVPKDRRNSSPKANGRISSALRFDDHLESFRLRGAREGVVGFENMVELEAVRDQAPGVDLAGQDGLEQHRYGDGIRCLIPNVTRDA